MWKQVYFLTSPHPAVILCACSFIVGKMYFFLWRSAEVTVWTGAVPQPNRGGLHHHCCTPPLPYTQLLLPRLSSSETQRLMAASHFGSRNPATSKIPASLQDQPLFCSARGISVLQDELIMSSPRLVSDEARQGDVRKGRAAARQAAAASLCFSAVWGEVWDRGLGRPWWVKAVLDQPEKLTEPFEERLCYVSRPKPTERTSPRSAGHCLCRGGRLCHNSQQQLRFPVRLQAQLPVESH